MVVEFGFLVDCVGCGGWRRFFRLGLSLFGVTLKVWEGFPSFSPCGLVGRLVGGGLCVFWRSSGSCDLLYGGGGGI